MTKEYTEETARLILKQIIKGANKPKKVKVNGLHYNYYTSEILKDELYKSAKDIQKKLFPKGDKKIWLNISTPTNYIDGGISCTIIFDVEIVDVSGSLPKSLATCNLTRLFEHKLSLPLPERGADTMMAIGDKMKVIGSIITYMSRYSLMQVMGISSIEDDVETYDIQYAQDKVMVAKSKQAESKPKSASMSIDDFATISTAKVKTKTTQEIDRNLFAQAARSI